MGILSVAKAFKNGKCDIWSLYKYRFYVHCKATNPGVFSKD